MFVLTGISYGNDREPPHGGWDCRSNCTTSLPVDSSPPPAGGFSFGGVGKVFSGGAAWKRTRGVWRELWRISRGCPIDGNYSVLDLDQCRSSALPPPLSAYPSRTVRDSCGPAWAADKKTPSRASPREFRANCPRGIAVVLATQGETSASMNRISASNVAWGFRSLEGLEQGREAGLTPD